MNYINGNWQNANGVEFESLNPATGESIWRGRETVAMEVDDAVSASRAALRDWSRTSLEDRCRIVLAFQAELDRNQSELAAAISREVGKPLWDAATEVQAMISKIPVSIAALKERRRDFEIPVGTSRGLTRYRPHGVMAVYGPFNFPGHIANGQIVPALLAGNTILFKPSELSPLVAEETVRLWEHAGLPAGVMNLVQGGKATGEWLAKHPGVNGILFTGSLQTGIVLRKTVLEQPEKILVLELGGNNPLVVHQVDDITAAVYWAIQSAFVTSGQRCTCARRLIVTEGNEAFLNAFVEAARRLTIGPPDADPQPFLGPLINPSAVDRVIWEQQHLLDAGGESLLMAKQLPLGRAYVSPGMIDVTNSMTRSDREVFGPLVQVIRVPDLAAAIQEANATQYGLVASLFSKDRADFEQFYDGVRAGLVNWNKPTTGASGELPFGGLGRSGNHRPAGSFAVDFCNVPVASIEEETLSLPAQLAPGVTLS